MKLYQITIAEYHVENTQLHHVSSWTRASINLVSGNHYESDIDHIKQTFHGHKEYRRDLHSGMGVATCSGSKP
eukprot:7376929-Prymnesium_polylepis.1